MDDDRPRALGEDLAPLVAVGIADRDVERRLGRAKHDGIVSGPPCGGSAADTVPTTRKPGRASRLRGAHVPALVNRAGGGARGTVPGGTVAVLAMRRLRDAVATDAESNGRKIRAAERGEHGQADRSEPCGRSHQNAPRITAPADPGETQGAADTSRPGLESRSLRGCNDGPEVEEGRSEDVAMLGLGSSNAKSTAPSADTTSPAPAVTAPAVRR